MLYRWKQFNRLYRDRNGVCLCFPIAISPSEFLCRKHTPIYTDVKTIGNSLAYNICTTSNKQLFQWEINLSKISLHVDRYFQMYICK